jgi:hypothetical protein
MDWKIAAGLLARHLLTTLGGIAVAKGFIDASQLEPVAGALLIIGGVVWSIVQKQRAAK